jgi:hypothetical protein
MLKPNQPQRLQGTKRFPIEPGRQRHTGKVQEGRKPEYGFQPSCAKVPETRLLAYPENGD